jgi:branched-chain amino acid transport system ATP-binding protein
MTPMLEVSGVTAGYGRVEVLRNLSFTVPTGSVVALIGPNGVGKTTALRTIAGTLGIKGGTIELQGERVNGRPPMEIARRGLTLVPEGRGIFPRLTVRENLQVAAHADREADREGREARLERVLETFPRLRERSSQLAGTLSGGEQQMLALSRAFLARPRLLVMDEISMGLAPMIVEELYEQIRGLADAGMTILLVEQFLTYALGLADLCYVMKKGRIAFVGDPAELRADTEVAGYFG